MISQLTRNIFLYLSTFFILSSLSAQVNKITIDMEKDKPEKFKTKVLRSERTGQKKFTIPRRFIQNTVSHYNYFFNGNNKVREVIEKARMANRDDYTTLLPFYSYSLDNTSQQTMDLDSIILKATAGILLHDLRSNWVDNFYLLIGKAYYLRKDFDSASQTFQFINYNLYPKKRKNGDDQVVVGSNDNTNSSALSISNKEDRNLVDKAFTRPPSRNDAFIWQIRTYTDMGEYGDAAGLINTLQNDPNFPGRLDPYFEEAVAYWFYKQEMYDSAMLHLQNTLDITLDMQDQARREFLLAQLFEKNGSLDTASAYYTDAIHHTVDPLMDIYGNLNKAKMLKSRDPEAIDESIQVLERMARRDKYDLYRDIIYFAAGELAMEKPDTSRAIGLYLASVKYNEGNPGYKNKSFLKLADISYSIKDYKHAQAYYDSLQLDDTALANVEEITRRKEALTKIVAHINVIEREDSLQSIAKLSEAERDDYIKKLSKQLRKERGVKDGDSTYFNAAAAYYDSRNPQQNIFSSSTDAKGEWYFYNASLKQRGAAEFRRIWGKRPNADNWRRSGNSSASINQPPVTNLYDSLAGDPMAVPGTPAGQPGAKADNAEDELPVIPFQSDISVDGLKYNIPLLPEQLAVSNNKIAKSLFQLGKYYQVLLEDYYAAIDSYEESLKRFPDSLYQGELYMNLSFCYSKTGNMQKADYYKNLLLNKFSKSLYSQKILHPGSIEPSKKDPVATQRYDEIYNLFIEGKFEEAQKQKQKADSIYGNNYWDPQLLYIESVYYIRQREDSLAINKLLAIVNNHPESPMREKAETMIDVLEKRSSIEEYLTNLQIERAKEDSQIVVYYDSAKIIRSVQQPAIRNAPIQQKPVTIIADQPIINPDKKLEAPTKSDVYIFDETQPQSVIMILNKVDPVYINEAKNAFSRYAREKFRTSNLEVLRDTLDAENVLIVFNQFDNAVDAMAFTERAKRDARVEVSWLPANKYTFYIISADNLSLLKQKKNLVDYLQLLDRKYPGKF